MYKHKMEIIIITVFMLLISYSILIESRYLQKSLVLPTSRYVPIRIRVQQQVAVSCHSPCRTAHQSNAYYEVRHDFEQISCNSETIRYLLITTFEVEHFT